MTKAKISGAVDAPQEIVYDLIADPARLKEWDTSYEAASPLEADRDGAPTFEIDRTIANRGIHLSCRVIAAEVPSLFAFTCTGSAGEIVQESFILDPSSDGGTTLVREAIYELPGQDLGVIANQTYTQATEERSIEQSFARLNRLLGSSASTDRPSVPRETDTRSEDTGTISSEEPYTAHAKDDQPSSRPS